MATKQKEVTTFDVQVAEFIRNHKQKGTATDDEINSFKETLVLSSIDSLSKLVLNNPLSVLFTSTVRRNNNRAKMNVEFDSWICTRCC